MRRPALGILLCLLSTAQAGPADGVIAAAADATSLGAEIAPLTRYFYLGHLEDRQAWWQRIAGLCAGTSRKARIYRPLVILWPTKPGAPLEAADGLLVKKEDWPRAILIRIDISHQGWKREVIEKLALVEPHYHYREKKRQVLKVDIDKGLPVKPEAPEPEVQEVKLEGFQFYRSDGRGQLFQIERGQVEPGEEIYVRDRPGGALRKATAPARAAAKPKAKPTEARKDEKKEERADKVLLDGHGAEAEMAKLALLTDSDCPICYADWAWWQLSIQTEREPGPGYYDLLGIKDQDTFHNLIGYDPKLFRERFAEFVIEFRAAVAKSKISRQPRRISVDDKIKGKVWITFDKKLARGNRNPLDTPNGDFEFDATEQMGHLPNGFFAQGLFNFQGVRQDSAPDFVGHDKTTTGEDGRIHCGICWRCHDNGLKPVKDWYSAQYELPDKLLGPERKKIEDIREKYFGHLERELEPSIAIHAAAVKEATGLTLTAYSKLISTGWYYVEDAGVDMKRAAREFGCTPEVLQEALRSWHQDGKLNATTVLSMYIKPVAKQQVVPVLQFWDELSEGRKALAAYKKARP